MSRTRNKVHIKDYSYPFNNDRDIRFHGFHHSVSKWYRKFHRRQIRRADKGELAKDTEDKVFCRFRKNFWYWYW